MKTKILAVFLTLSLAVMCAACGEKNNAAESRAEVVESRANAQGTTDTEISASTDIARTTDILTETDIPSLADTDSQLYDVTDTDTELIETELDEQAGRAPSAVELGAYTLTAERVELDKNITVSSSDRLTGEMWGDTLYILDKNKLIGCYISGASAQQTSEIKLSSDYTRIDADSSGTIYLSGDALNAAYLGDDGGVYETDVSGKLSLSDTSDFGLVYSKRSDNVLKYSGGTTENWVLTNMKDSDTRKGDFNMISNIEIIGDKVFVTGSCAEENNARKLALYDTEGNLISLSDDKTSGSGIVSVTDTENGYMACSDGTLALWNYDGSLAALSTSGELSQLFGTDEVITINGLFSLNDGAVLALCSSEKDGKTIAELYRIMGF